ncbi:hypothetical protein [Cryptosporangium sp. NPDC048952]|uniref:hypothetical protein n=1 Tax=Cryptosporangium sp. NPDC048952 TaxID=3363961 RepID=UPI00371E60C2
MPLLTHLSAFVPEDRHRRTQDARDAVASALTACAGPALAARGAKAPDYVFGWLFLAMRLTGAPIVADPPPGPPRVRVRLAWALIAAALIVCWLAWGRTGG